MPLNSGTEENWSKSLEKTFSVYRNSTEEHMRMTAGVIALKLQLQKKISPQIITKVNSTKY